MVDPALARGPLTIACISRFLIGGSGISDAGTGAKGREPPSANHRTLGNEEFGRLERGDWFERLDRLWASGVLPQKFELKGKSDANGERGQE